jgi:hypothetical protein
METSDMIRQLCKKKDISLAELCRRIGQTPQNFNKKLKRNTVSLEGMMVIAKVLEVGYEQAFILPEGEKVGICKDINSKEEIYMEDKDKISSQATDVALSAAGSLVGFAIGGPIGAVVGGAATPTTKLAYQLISSWNERRKVRITNIVEQAFVNSGRNDEDIFYELLENPEWADSIISMIQQLVYTDPELDGLFAGIMASAIGTEDENERNRMIVLNSSIKGLNKVQVLIIRYIYDNSCKLSAENISKMVNVPELELRNAVRDLELRGMIIDNGEEPTIWELRELGMAVAKAINVLEV